MFNKPSRDGGAPAPQSHNPTPQQAYTPPPAAPAPAPAAARKPPERAASVLGADLVIKGGIEGRGEIQLQGRAWGDVKVERLMVGEAAQLEGSVEAVVVEVRGKVTGSIAARQVKLHPSAKVEGDITYEQLSIDNGAFFEGRCIRSKGEAGQPATNGAKKGDGAPAPANG